MTEVEKDALLKEHLEVLLPAFSPVLKSEAIKFIDAANGCLSKTPFIFFLFGDGVKVVLREQMRVVAEHLFDRDCFKETQ